MKIESFKEKLGTWVDKLTPFIESEECDKIYAQLKEMAQKERILPDSKDTFRAFSVCPYEKLRVVIVGMEPYANTIGEKAVADGVAFSCGNTGILQPSLKKWYEGLQEDMFSGTAIKLYEDPNLDFLGKEGVLMLNSSLTVSKGRIGSHKGLWDPFMHYLIGSVFNSYNPGLIYILMGKEAERWEEFITPLGGYVLKCEHPAAAARDKREWEHDNVFSKANEILRKNNGEEVYWDSLPF